jgi:hypothetical protein
MTTKTKYTARATRAGKWWAISVLGVQGAHTQVRRLDQAEATTRDLLSLLLDATENSFDVEIVPELNDEEREALDTIERARATGQR